jgi:hypothetical protein
MLELTSVKLNYESKVKAKLLNLNISEICRVAVDNAVLNFGTEEEKELYEIENEIREKEEQAKAIIADKQTLVMKKSAIEARLKQESKQQKLFVDKQLEAIKISGGAANFVE